MSGEQSSVADLLSAARDLVDAVAFDDCGALIAGQWRGGNGGLISRQTIEKADTLRRLVNDFHTREEAHGDA